MKASRFVRGFPLIAILSLVATPTAQMPLTAVGEAFDTQPDPAWWSLGGAAAWDASSQAILLTDAADDRAGSIFWLRQMGSYVFHASFDFWIGGGSGGDGLTFAWVKGPDFLGGGGESLGFDGLDGYAIRFDTHSNGAGEPIVGLDNPNPPFGISHFFAPEVTMGNVITFELTVVSASKGTLTHELDVTLLAGNPPRVPPTNLRALPTDRGFWLFWDPVPDAECYEIEWVPPPDVWIPLPPLICDCQYEVKDQDPGTQLTLRVRAKNRFSTLEEPGAVSEPLSVTIMRNLALPEEARGTTPPSEYVCKVSPPSPDAMNDVVRDESSNSWEGKPKSEDYWGYLWEEPLYFDHIVYFTGDFFWQGGWFTDLTVQYTEDGTNWLEASDVQITPDYDFRDHHSGRDPFTRYDISFMPVRGKGIRIDGTPGGMGTFTSISELGVYGDQVRANPPAAPERVVPEGSTVRLDGSYLFWNKGEILSYHWEQVSGPPVFIGNQDSVIASFQAPGVDEDTLLLFRLTAVTETEVWIEDFQVTVKSLITTADAGPDRIVSEGSDVILDGTASQTTSGDITYQWTQVGVPTVSLSNPNSAVCTFTAPEIWSFTKRLTFQLTVDDGVGGISTDEVNANVTNSVFETEPLPRYYFQDMLHLGQSPSDGIIGLKRDHLQGPDDMDYLANWGGAANINPVEGEEYDFIDTGILTTVNPLIWTPLQRDDGWFMQQSLARQTRYWHIYVFAPEAREARLRFRYDGQLRIWNNGTVAVARDGWDCRTEQAQDFILNEGVNSMTVMLEEGGGGGYFAVRVTDREDIPYTDLSYSLSVPNPLPQAYAVRSLPDSYESPGTLNVELSVRAHPDNLPETITVSETIPEGLTVADSGGGEVRDGTLTWAFAGLQAARITYSLSVPAGTTASLELAGDVNGDDTFGDSVTYAVSSAPRYVVLSMMFGALLTWSPPPEEGVDGYQVFRSVDGGDWEQVAFTRESWYSEGISDWSTYSFKVRAVNKGGMMGAFCEVLGPASLGEIELIREAEHFNCGGRPWTPGCQANEAPSSDALDPIYDFFFANDIPQDDARRFYRPNDNVAIETALDFGTTDKYHISIGWTTLGDWFRYTFDVPAPGPDDPAGGWARIGLRLASPGGGTVKLYWDERLLGTISYATPDWHAMRWYPLEDAFRTTPGEHTLRVKLVSGQLNFDKIGLAFNLKVRREVIFEDDFEDYANLYDWTDLETFGGWDVINVSREPLVGWRLWNTAGNYLGDDSDDRHPALAGMRGNYVIADSDLVGTADLDEELISPEIDCTDWLRLRLSFSKNFRVYPDDFDHTQIAEVDIRAFDITTWAWDEWVNLLHFDYDTVPPDLDPAIDSSPEKLDLSAYDGEIIQLRWHFYDAVWDWWFAIDDVMVSGEYVPAPPPPPPPPPPGRDIWIVGGCFFWPYDGLRIVWRDVGAAVYYLEYSGDLAAGEWEPVVGPIIGTECCIAFLGGNAGYFRVRSE